MHAQRIEIDKDKQWDRHEINYWSFIAECKGEMNKQA